MSLVGALLALAVLAEGQSVVVSLPDGDRVEWRKGRFGFVSPADVAPTEGKVAGGVAEVWQHEPPRIVLEPAPQKGAPVVDGDQLRIEGSASVPAGPTRARLRDVFIFVNDQKVYFQVAPDGATTRIDFAANLPLKPGNNVVTVFAREDDEFQSHRSFVVHRRVAEVAAQGAR